MARRLANWLKSYMEYASVTEAPQLFHNWTGVATLGGALRKKVWIDQVRFKWTPCFYIVLVAPPGISQKSSTVDIGMELLRQVPGIKFGPDAITWQSLVQQFSLATEAFEFDGAFHPMSPLTLVASEFGNLIDFRDAQMVNLMITLWDGRPRFEKKTKTSGDDMVEAPWINMIACTTPAWIAGNMSQNTIGGGFTSRCIFVYADHKERLVPFLDEVVPTQTDEALKAALLQDLEHISLNLTGKFEITPSARSWMHARYRVLWESEFSLDNEDYINNYIARKQAHLCKTAMVLSASRNDSLIIEEEDFAQADGMLDLTETLFGKVFKGMGRADEHLHVERFLAYVKAKGQCKYDEAYRQVQPYLPDHKHFEGLLKGMISAGQARLDIRGDGAWMVWTGAL